MDPARLALALVGAIIAIVAPRFQHVTLMVFSALLAALVATGVLVARGAEIWMVVVGLPLALVCAVLVARALPRLATFLLLALSLALAALTVTGGSRPALWVALGLAVLLLGVGHLEGGPRRPGRVRGDRRLPGLGGGTLCRGPASLGRDARRLLRRGWSRDAAPGRGPGRAAVGSIGALGPRSRRRSSP